MRGHSVGWYVNAVTIFVRYFGFGIINFELCRNMVLFGEVSRGDVFGWWFTYWWLFGLKGEEIFVTQDEVHSVSKERGG